MQPALCACRGVLSVTLLRTLTAYPRHVAWGACTDSVPGSPPLRERQGAGEGVLKGARGHVWRLPRYIGFLAMVFPVTLPCRELLGQMTWTSEES